MKKENQVIALGELLVDLISHNYDNNLSEARNFQAFQGGSPANFCANLQWLGVSSRLIAAIGDDGMGKFLLNQLKHIGVETQEIQIVNHIPTSLVLVAKSKGTPDFLAYRLADKYIKINESHFKNIGSDVIHTSAFALSLEPARGNILSALKLAKLEGKTISIDWNFAKEIWVEGGSVEVFKEVVTLNPLLKMSLDDYQRFQNKPDANQEEARLFLENLGLSFCCLTCGANGVWYKDANSNWIHVNARPVESVLDTTGAGDAFWAGFISEWLNEKNCAKAIASGLEVAAKKVAKVGPLYL